MSNDDKRDLTRIEDLGEFVHEMNSQEEVPDFSDDLPDIPSFEEGSIDFGTTEEPAFSIPEEQSIDALDFGTTEEAPSLETSDFSTEENVELSTGFETSEEDTLIPNEEPTFEVNEFSAIDEKINEIEELSPIEETAVLETEVALEDEWKIEKLAVETKEFKAPENFEDLKKFSENSSFSGMATEGNPSFSVLLKKVRYIEDINDIINLLRELNLLVDSEEQVKNRLMRGMLLVPRISEYAAIFLAHKLRRFDIDIQVGLSDEIHPQKHQETPETGIVSKFNLFQNQTHHFHFDDPKLDMSQIMVSATQGLEGYQVLRYMGIASEHKILDSFLVEDENSTEVPHHYKELAQKLKAHALKAHSNAVVGLNYQLTPLPSEFGTGGHKYRLSCTGNLVWVNKL